MKQLILLLCVFLSSSLYALKDKDLVFFINGDWYYQGPQFEENGIRLKDQAKVLYQELIQRARKDRENNYVVFYDPKGKGNLLNRRWVKFRIYKKGKRVYSHGLRDSEIDTSSPQFFQLFQSIIKKHLGKMKRTNSLFYYYGEHFPAVGEANLDLSSEHSGFGLEKLKSFLQPLGEFHTLVFHTCYMNALDFVGPLLEYSNEVIVPHKAILNTPLNWESSFRKGTFNQFSEELISQYPKENKYRLHRYDQRAKKYYEKIRRLKSYTSAQYWSEFMSKTKTKSDEQILELSNGSFVLRDWNDSQKREIFVPHYEYINLIDRYLKAGEEELDSIDRFLDKNPQLEELFILL